MLTMPEDSPTTACIVGIDPGSQTLGLAILEFDTTTKEIVKTTAITYVGTKLPYMSDWITKLHGERAARIIAHRENLTEIFKSINPTAVYCESPFYNPGRPMAYGALVEVLSAIRLSIINWSQWVGLESVDPPTVKKAVGARGGAKKDEMMVAVQAMEKELKLDKSPSEYDEHCIDAIAVAYYGYKIVSKTL